jgi:hypothetical protein
MGLICKYMDRYKKDERTGFTVINLAEIRKLEIATTGKDPFRMEDFPELVKLGYATNVNIKSNDEVFTTIKAEEFTRNFRLQRVVMAIHSINEQKAVGTKSA